MLRLPALALVAALTTSATVAQSAASLPGAEIAWRFGGDRGGASTLRFSRQDLSIGLDADDAPQIIEALGAATRAPTDRPIAFSLSREAGALACTGRVVDAGAAKGTCTFDPDERFARALAERDLGVDDAGQLLALALVDAHIGSVDEFARIGLHIGDSSNLISLSALGATPDFAKSLKDADLRVETIDELIAARALKVTPEWLSAMAAAGYPGLSAEQVIELRATGVTPDYARRMARVISATAEAK